MKKENIESFTELFEKALLNDDRHYLYQFITGHTMIEYLLFKIVSIKEPNLTHYSENLNHKNLIELVSGLNLITKEQKHVLLAINTMRNKFAHNIGYMPSVKDFGILVNEAIAAFSDLSDGLHQLKEELQNIKSLSELESWGFYDFFIQISYDLHNVYIDLGGDHEIFHKTTKENNN